MEYSLPRLTRAWTHLSRQRGGAKGNRGEGETQLEIDRRIVLKKIAKMKKELSEIKKQRNVRRSRRSEKLLSACIVGYTNAGKSSLLNKLCGSEILAEDKLFATLDSTTRLLKLPGGTELTLTDTVGFIRDLPHKLVQAFHSTLEEAILADFLILVIDASDPDAQQQYKTTISTLKEINAADKKRLVVFNKIDNIENKLLGRIEIRPIQQEEERCVYCSVKTGEGIDELFAQIEQLLSETRSETTFIFPADNEGYKIAAQLHSFIEIIEEEYKDSEIIIKAICPEEIRMRFESFIKKE
ncbi:MAG: GTPase HflX [Spirochaetales bacterium]|nr:GTPase HflX [Spirochaetales bacterium]